MGNEKKNGRKMESDVENVEVRYIRPDEDDDGYDEWVGWTDGKDVYRAQNLKISRAEAIQTIAQVLDQIDDKNISSMDIANKIAFEMGFK